jgi:hypothetical protein
MDYPISHKLTSHLNAAPQIMLILPETKRRQRRSVLQNKFGLYRLISAIQ